MLTVYLTVSILLFFISQTMRREPQTQWRFLRNANTGHLEVHDLDNETDECQVQKFIKAGHAYYVQIQNNKAALEQWLKANPSYDGCAHCLPEYNRK